ncbi:MAG: YidC/Oxa1 family insertase periplasmic-domain containing protein [Gemmataceae bacterium]|nr:YidC/Oxa1 family insertase periplasmic-domain containing protein [Gemmataceae bacterium]
MQQQVPIRNYVVFFISVFALTIGWSSLKPRLFPEPAKPGAFWPVDAPRADQAVLVARMIAAGNAADAVAQSAIGPIPGRAALSPWPYQTASRNEQDQAVVRMVASQIGDSSAGPALLAAAVHLNNKVIARHAAAAQPAQEFTLGGPGQHLTATLTTQGAGVRELILNDFPAADKYGLPVTKDGKPMPVTLLPRVEGVAPAFSIFHYSRPDDDKERPLDTLGQLKWTVVKNDAPREMVFAADVPEFGLRVIKTFTLKPGEYHLGLTVRIERTGAGNGTKFRYQLAGGRALPIEGEWYATTFRNTMVGLLSKSGSLYRLWNDNVSLSRLGGSDRYRRDDKKLLYAAVAVQYFASAIAVDDLDAEGKKLPGDKTGFLEFVRATVEGTTDPKLPMLDDVTVRAIAEPVDPTADAPVEHRYVLYHGPVKVRQLQRLPGSDAVAPELVERYADSLQLASLTDYGNFGLWTDVIIKFTNLIHRLLGWLHAVFPAGISIMLVTVIVRGMMFPISRRQAASMQKMQEKMQKLGPEMKEIEKKYKDDFLMKQQAQRELYRKHNVNPAAGLGGCLMLFMQMPIFMGLYFALQESVFFRLDSFLWIRNLAAPDMLAWWGESIPWISKPDGLGGFLYLGPYFNLLPVVGAVLIFMQQKLSMPAEMSEEQRQQASIMKYMTGVMAIMFYRVPAGLSLYFICSSIWGLTERKLVKKMLANEAAKPVPPKQKSQQQQAPGKLAAWWAQVLRDASKK